MIHIIWNRDKQSYIQLILKYHMTCLCWDEDIYIWDDMRVDYSFNQHVMNNERKNEYIESDKIIKTSDGRRLKLMNE